MNNNDNNELNELDKLNELNDFVDMIEKTSDENTDNDYNFINHEFIFACEDNKLLKVREIMYHPLLDVKFNNFECLKMACWNGNHELIDNILEKYGQIILSEPLIIDEIVSWVIFDENKELWGIMRKHYKLHPEILTLMLPKVIELKHLDKETIPESKLIVYIPYSIKIITYLINWPIIGRIIKWFL